MIYLDNAATTLMYPEVRDTVSYYEKYFTYVLNDNNHSKSTTIFLNELKNFCKHFYR